MRDDSSAELEQQAQALDDAPEWSPDEAEMIDLEEQDIAARRKAIHTRLVNLKFSSSIGGTHVEQLGGARDLPGPRPVLFFAPAQIKKRSAEWGAQGLGQRLVQSWAAFVARATNPAQPWLQVQYHAGGDAALAAYQQVLGGKGDPRQGHILSL